MTVILDCTQIERIIRDLSGQIVSEAEAGLQIAVIGIRSRGEIIAQRLSSRLSEELGKEVPCGTLDITLYRDDLNSPQGSDQPLVRTTEIGFDIGDTIIDLVDDALYTGPDYAGYKSDADPDKLVKVRLVESDGKDEVVIE